MTALSQRFPHYWICDSCAAERGGVMPEGNVTMAQKTCEYCDGKKQAGQFVTPWVDFDWPDAEATRTARIVRD